jgi:aspartate ammonia-lyase
VTEKRDEYRIERDPLGEVPVARTALYGAQTQRALENFKISSLRVNPALIVAFAEIKKAAALTNTANGQLTARVGEAIQRAAGEVIEGKWWDQFDLDVFQAGAGTSYNMNVNEVIANRALEILSFDRGDYSQIHPNDHVNRSQSTNDVMPTAMRIAMIRLVRKLVEAGRSLCDSFDAKAVEFADVIKAGSHAPSRRNDRDSGTGIRGLRGKFEKSARTNRDD